MSSDFTLVVPIVGKSDLSITVIGFLSVFPGTLFTANIMVLENLLQEPTDFTIFKNINGNWRVHQYWKRVLNFTDVSILSPSSEF